MAREADPGWYQHADGAAQYWDGTQWTGLVKPAPPDDRQPAWHAIDGGLQQWWDGLRWLDVFAADDGHVDVRRNIGQAIITATKLGGLDGDVVAALLAGVVTWPPVRIAHLNTYTSAVAPGTNLVAVVEWDGPRR